MNKRSVKATAVLLLLTLTSMTRAAEGELNSGNYMLPACKQAIDLINRTPKSDLMIGAMEATSCIAFMRGYLNGFTHGQMVALAKVRNKSIAAEETLPYRTFCIDGTVPMTQLVRVFVLHMESHPEKLHYPADVLLLDSFVKAFPCKKAE